MKKDEEKKMLSEILERSNQIYSMLKRLDANPPSAPVKDISERIHKIK